VKFIKENQAANLDDLASQMKALRKKAAKFRKNRRS
jgi:hypothetical protein